MGLGAGHSTATINSIRRDDGHALAAGTDSLEPDRLRRDRLFPCGSRIGRFSRELSTAGGNDVCDNDPQRSVPDRLPQQRVQLGQDDLHEYEPRKDKNTGSVTADEGERPAEQEGTRDDEDQDA